MASNKKILIIGNGPSTAELAAQGFQNIRPDIDTFGMGIAYRFFREIGWWPTYYALGDSKVVFSHRTALGELVEDPAVTTERFFFSWPVSEGSRLELIDHSSTGDFCFRKCLDLGYEEIYLIGIEGHYVEEVLGSEPISDARYTELGLEALNLKESLRTTLRIITETPAENPNYFFYGYQQTGDVYSLPQSGRHRDRWQEAAEVAEDRRIRVLNLSESSRVAAFPKSPLAIQLDRILREDREEQLSPTTAVLTGRASPAPGSRTTPVRKPEFWFGPFDRESGKRTDEAQVVGELFNSELQPGVNPVMIDVGACKGGAFREFANSSWKIHAFEPNPPLFKDLVKKFDLPNVELNSLAVSDVEGEEIPFYTSDESIGISSLRAFRSTHKETAQVRTTTLNHYLEDKAIDRIDFLKIDTEGFDLMVLKGIDLYRHDVEVILCEFEDAKTGPLGYSTGDLAGYLQSHGYTVYVSEWHPVIRYGGPHQWRALKQYPCELETPEAWGNLFAFKTDPGMWALTGALKKDLQGYEEKRKIKEAPKAKKKPAARSKPLAKSVRPSDRSLLLAQRRIEALELQLATVYASTSWRITAPIRGLKSATVWLLRRLSTNSAHRDRNNHR